MRIINTPENIYICRDCNYVDTDGVDKCPSCSGDDWIIYTKEEEEDWYEE